METKTNETVVKRIGGYLHRIVPLVDKSGKVMSYALKPLMVEFKPRDIFQVIVGASLLSIPVAFTEEVWVLAENLPLFNVMLLAFLSMVVISGFVYYNFYRYNFKDHTLDFIKRIVGTYGVSLLVVAAFLTIIQKCPWGVDNILAIKRIIIVALPASMGGTLSDTIK